jgi:hypothetical protein
MPTGSMLHAASHGEAHPSGELGEVVCRMQALEGEPPLVPVNQVVPVGNDVVDRAAGLAGNAASMQAPCRVASCP